jgi:hypothetical protein
MKIGFDFDGTIATCPKGVRLNFQDPLQSMAHSAAMLGPVQWIKRALSGGHEVVIVTGRGRDHAAPLRYWLQRFVGARLQVITRPDCVGLNVEAQAAWKATILMSQGIQVYVGDNRRIDQVAARLAGIRFMHASAFHEGLPPQPPTLVLGVSHD